MQLHTIGTVTSLIIQCVFFGLSYEQKPKRSYEYKIKKLIKRGYDKTTRPVRVDNSTVVVYVAIALYHILDTNEKQQTFTSILSIRQRWKDEYLTWNQTQYGGVKSIHIPANQIWTPDLVISNFAGEKFNDFMVTNAIVKHNGEVLWLLPAMIKTYCTINVKYFPFDTQKCSIVFISWTYHGFQLYVNYTSIDPNTIYYIPENQEWTVIKITVQKHEKKYACCAEPYPDVTFTIHMRRGSLFYIFNLIFPCFLIYLISFLGFYLPVESGEKVNLEVTILLALVVFLLMVGETMPPTPDAIPILGMFFGCTMCMVTVALVMAVIVTHVYSKRGSGTSCPRWLSRASKKFYPAMAAQELGPSRNINSRACLKHSPNGDIPSPESDMEYYDEGCCCNCGVERSLRSRQESYRRDAEWRLAAAFVDRTFFWVFVALSVCTQTILFIQLIPTGKTPGTE